ncbi:unnamed protein product, partial [Urochloa humidicola]
RLHPPLPLADAVGVVEEACTGPGLNAVRLGRRRCSLLASVRQAGESSAARHMQIYGGDMHEAAWIPRGGTVNLGHQATHATDLGHADRQHHSRARASSGNKEARCLVQESEEEIHPQEAGLIRCR